MALVADVGEVGLEALDAVRLAVVKDVALLGQTLLAAGALQRLLRRRAGRHRIDFHRHRHRAVDVWVRSDS